jgi:hypothetical protein
MSGPHRPNAVARAYWAEIFEGQPPKDDVEERRPMRRRKRLVRTVNGKVERH